MKFQILFKKLYPVQKTHHLVIQVRMGLRHKAGMYLVQQKSNSNAPFLLFNYFKSLENNEFS
jgi:hypothetical protein